VEGRTFQKDGWGVSHYVGGIPVVERSPNPVYKEKDRFAAVASRARSNIVVAHIRDASNPKHLARSKLIGIENTQPFCDGKYVFAHNGTINLPDELEAELGEYRNAVKGVNDSEVYFWFLMKEIHTGKTPIQAFRTFVERLDELWIKFAGNHKDSSFPYVGLNTILSDGEKIYAFCKFHEEYADRPSLCRRDQSYWQMSYLTGDRRFIVASEPLTTNGNWKVLDSGEVLSAWIDHGKIAYEVRQIQKAIIQ
jgi:predicted glutamine amidotransferase